MPSKKNIDLATKIIKQKAEVSDEMGYWDFDLMNTLGEHFLIDAQKPGKKEGTTVKVSKTEATEEAISRLANELEKGELELSETWAKDNKLR